MPENIRLHQLPTTTRRTEPHRRAWRGCLHLTALLSLLLAGCEYKSFFNPAELVDPSESNRLRTDGSARPRVQTILSELDLGVSAVPRAFTDTRAVQAGDLEVNAQDYRIGPGDLIEVSISDLGPAQTPFVRALRVSDTGLLLLPDLPTEYRQLRVAGLTEIEAAAEIARVYVDAGVFTAPPQVTLLVIEPNSKVFSITGNVLAPSRYVIPKADFRMIDALVTGRANTDPDVNGEWAYVIRARDRNTPPQQVPPDQGDPLRPRSSAEPRESDEWPFEEPRQRPSAPTFASAHGQPAGTRPTGGFEFQAPQEPADTEIIRVPVQELLRGNLRYNIVVRPEDTIIIPPPPTGEYYVYGHVIAPGAFAMLPGRRLTVKQAITTARGLDEVAIPSRTQFIRRIDDQDVFVRIDLAKIFVGQEPDIYLQPNDMIMVGTNAFAGFLAALRNGFRVTYGFGFIYDRNFAYDSDNARFF